MKRVSLAAVTAVTLFSVAACQDAVTSPQPGDLRLALRASNPPPPPIDTGSTGSFVPTNPDLRTPSTPKFLQPRYSIVQSSSPTEGQKTILAAPRARRFDFVQSPFFFSVPITYFFNKTSNDGYVHFSNDPDGVNSSSNGMVKNHGGVLSGKGTLTIQTDGGLLVIDLSSIQQPPSFLGCGAPAASTNAPTNDGGVCFDFYFTHATLYPPSGPPIDGHAETFPGCTPESCPEET